MIPAQAPFERTPITQLKLLLALSRTPHGLLDMATPPLCALLWLGHFPEPMVILLGLLTSFAGYTAVYALNDLIDYRSDKEKISRGGLLDPTDDLDAVIVRHPLAQDLLTLKEAVVWTVAWALVALIGAFLLIRVIREIARTNEAFRPYAIPITIVYIVFVFMSWLADPIFNLLLRLDPIGRYALTRDQTLGANCVGVLIFGALLAVGGYFIWGSAAFLVGAAVWFENGEPFKNEYRHFKIETVEGIDDYAAMQEVVGRYFTRRVEEERKLPDLVLVDGGKGQLSAAAQALERAGVPDLPLTSLAKREELIFTLDRSEPLRLSRREPGLRLLQQVRDEAHRFGLQYHRKRRSRRTLHSELLDVPGVGPARQKALIRAFGSLKEEDCVATGEPEPVAY